MLLMYRNANNFYILILYSETLTNCLINTNKFSGRQLYHLNNGNLLLPHLILVMFICFFVSYCVKKFPSIPSVPTFLKGFKKL